MGAHSARPTGVPAEEGRLRRAYLLETAVYFLVLVPWMGFATLGRRPDDLGFPLVATVIVLHDVALTALALYLVWRNGEGAAAVGWVRRGWGREALLGVALFVPLFLGVAILETLLRAAGFAEPVKPPTYLLPQVGTDYVFALVLLVVVAVAEETVFRGYLLRRFVQLTGSARAAVVLTSLIFALGHGYQGPLGVIAVGAIGAAFAAVYLWRGSLVAPVVMHFIQNFLGLIVAPSVLQG
ncbi:MAG TPA: CPBP family intramembrane glutamic endopeptidase [Burkholderiales bacterium]